MRDLIEREGARIRIRNNILEASTGAFYIKISRISSVSRFILGMPTFREPCSL